MDTIHGRGTIDLISTDDVRRLGSVAGPCVSVYMPTHQHGAETRQGAVRLRNLVAKAVDDLTRADIPVDEADELLAPLRSLIDDGEFWQHQSSGLVLFAAPGFFTYRRLPLDVVESVTVGTTFRVVPLVPLLSGDGRFFVLALSQNSVRLFDADRFRIGELDLGPVPTSIAEALAHEDPERELQVRAGGGGTALFHGHGAGDEVDKQRVERFIRAVDAGLSERIGDADRPLVLASVAYYLPILKSVSTYPTIMDAVVEGNPDHRTAEELHAAAWPVVEQRFTAESARAAERYREARGTGKAIDDVDQVFEAAVTGRVEALILTDGGPIDQRVDRSVLDTLAHGGRVLAGSENLTERPLAALLRY